MEIIQPFINAADAVLRDAFRGPARIDTLSMETSDVHHRGIAAVVCLQGDIEGRIVLDLGEETARLVAARLGEPDTEAALPAQDVVCELANQVIGNAITVLNDCGYHFRVLPPEISSSDRLPKSSTNTEALLMKFETDSGPVFLNIALRTAKTYAAD